MKKNCIFCDSNKGSAEHIFPSVFGGRLVNKSIYCEKHNNDLGDYVDILDQSIGALNNIFGIKPDRGSAKAIKFTDSKTGEVYNRSIDGSFTLSVLDNIDVESILNNGFQNIQISSLADIELLKKHFKENFECDLKFSNISKPEQQIIENSLQVKTHFGGPDFFKATLYLLITFLAHYDRAKLEQINIKRIQEILLGEEDDTSEIFKIVDFDNFPSFLMDDIKQVRHSFAFIKYDNILYGILSYFNTATYTVKIDEYRDDFDNFVVYVNPLGQSVNPNDDMVKEPLSSNIKVQFNPELHKDKIKSMVNNSENTPSESLMKKLSYFENNRQNDNFIIGIRNCSTIQEMQTFWQNNRQQIYNSIKILAKDTSYTNDNISLIIGYLIKILDLSQNDQWSSLINILKTNLKELDGFELIKLSDLDSFIDQVCINLSEYFFNNLPSDSKNDIFHEIRRVILLESLNNVMKINKLMS